MDPMGRFGRRGGQRVALPLAIVALLLGAAPAAWAAQPDAAGAGIHAIVTFKAKPNAAAKDAIKQAGGKVRHEFTLIPAISVELPEAAFRALAKNPLVKSVQRDGKITILDHAATTGDLE